MFPSNLHSSHSPFVLFFASILGSACLLWAVSVFSSCRPEDPKNVAHLDTAYKEIKNLYAPSGKDISTTSSPGAATGHYVKFSFAKGSTTTGDDWDIAFRGTEIIVNGGKFKIDPTDENEPQRTGQGGIWSVDKLITEVLEIDDSKFITDFPGRAAARYHPKPTSPPNYYYTYDDKTNMVNIKPERVLVIRTHDKTYAKMQIISHYENATPNANIQATNYGYHTFRYLYLFGGGMQFPK